MLREIVRDFRFQSAYKAAILGGCDPVDTLVAFGLPLLTAILAAAEFARLYDGIVD